MKKTLDEFRGIVSSLEKIHRDGKQLGKGGSNQLTVKQLQQIVGVKPTLAHCLNGLMLLHDMHDSEYVLKVSLVSALSTLAVKPPRRSQSRGEANFPEGKKHCNTYLKSYLQKRSVDILL